MNKLKKLPKFKSEDEEQDFWASHDLTDYFDLKKAQRVIFPNLKPTSEAISLRLPVSLLYEVKILANSRDVPYQSLMKMFLAERVDEEFRKSKMSYGAVKN